MRRALAGVLVFAAACGGGSDAIPSTTAAGGTTEPRPGVCDRYGPGEVAGVLGYDDLSEASGIVIDASGTLWAHNDSGSEPRLFAMDRTGATLGVVEVEARNVDWEAIAVGPGPDGAAYLYVADIGDNFERRRHVTLYRFPVPSTADGLVAEPESLDVMYPGGPDDAETLVVDRATGDAFIVTKVPGSGVVYEVPATAWGSGTVEAVSVGAVPLPLPDAVVTGGDVSADGSVVALRTYGDVRLFLRDAGETIGEAMTHRSCSVATLEEAQGESVAFDGEILLTVGEGAGAEIHHYEPRP